MSKVGYLRVFVHKFEKNAKDPFDKGFEVMNYECFQLGLLSGGRGMWIDDEIRETYASPIPDCLEEHPPGFYELTGEMHYEAWQGYEGEWDAEWHIEKYEVRRLESWNEAFEYAPNYELFDGRFELREYGHLFHEEDDYDIYKKLHDYIVKKWNVTGCDHQDDILVLVNYFDNALSNNIEVKLPKYELNYLQSISDFLMERELLVKGESNG